MSEHSSIPAPAGAAAGPITARDRAVQQGPASSPGNEVVALVVHELRSPLAAISNLLEACRSRPNLIADPRAREVISRQPHRVLRLVDDLLDLTRVAAGRAPGSRR